MDNTEQKNIQNIMAYLIEINLLSQYFLKIRLLKAADLKNDDDTAEYHISRINKVWPEISLDQTSGLSIADKANLLDDIKRAQLEIDEDLARKYNFNSDLKTETEKILVTLSN